MHRVFPSHYNYFASSRKIQFHWNNTGDSEKVVTPFMQVGTYPTRNFATLGPSGLQPPFTGDYSSCKYTYFLPGSTGQASDPIRHLTILQSPVFLLNSRFFFFYLVIICITKYYFSLFQSYWANLPSSFGIINPNALVYSTSSPVLILVR